MPYVVAAFLAAHALIHTAYLMPRPAASGGPAWPFDMADSWAVVSPGIDVSIVRAAGVALIALTVVGYALAALAVAGFVIPEGWFVPLVVASSLASAVLLALFFHAWIVLGFVIDAAIVYAVLVAGWHPVAG